jgi:hypothetical protein
MTIYGPALNKYRMVKRLSSFYNETHEEALPLMKINSVRLEEPCQMWVSRFFRNNKNIATILYILEDDQGHIVVGRASA